MLFRSDPFLSSRTPAYEEVSTEVFENLVQSSSFPLLIASIVFSIWGVSIYLRCLDAVLRRRLVAIAAICTLWMIEVVVKYKSFTQAYTSLLWYLYYVPMTFIPLLFQLCGFRLAGLERRRAWRRYRVVLLALASVIVLFVLTNDLHHQVFCFDPSSDGWANDYTYGWGYAVILVWSAVNYVGFFIWSACLLRIGSGALRLLPRLSLLRARSSPFPMLCVSRGRGSSIFLWSIASFA